MFLRILGGICLFCITLGLLTPAVQAESLSVAEMELQRIAKQQEGLFEEIAQQENAGDLSDLERRMNDLLLSYELFITENPGNVYAWVLYGKLLLRFDEEERAYMAFLKADRLDPNLAVVKQQLGNYLAETGEYAASLAYFLQAIDLSPDTAIYHYQLGELLYTYRTIFIKKKVFTPELLDEQMLNAFKVAAELDPKVREFHMRYAEAFYDVNMPNWEQALAVWDALFHTSNDHNEQEVIRVHRARILMELHRPEEAKAELNQVFLPALERERRDLLDYLVDITA